MCQIVELQHGDHQRADDPGDRGVRPAVAICGIAAYAPIEPWPGPIARFLAAAFSSVTWPSWPSTRVELSLALDCYRSSPRPIASWSVRPPWRRSSSSSPCGCAGPPRIAPAGVAGFDGRWSRVVVYTLRAPCFRPEMGTVFAAPAIEAPRPETALAALNIALAQHHTASVLSGGMLSVAELVPGAARVRPLFDCGLKQWPCPRGTGTDASASGCLVDRI